MQCVNNIRTGAGRTKNAEKIQEINYDPPLPTVHCRFVPGKVHLRAQNVINTVTDWIKM